jgi:hypothetical protein
MNQLYDTVEQHGDYSIVTGHPDAPFVVLNEGVPLGGAPDMQEARYLVAEIKAQRASEQRAEIADQREAHEARERAADQEH